MSKVNILVLAAGQSHSEDGEISYPFCLTDFEGSTLIERLISNTQEIKNASYTFALRDDEVERYHLDRVVRNISPGCNIVRVPNTTHGSACTTLLAASQLPPEEEVLVISANELVDIDFNEVIAEFRKRELDAGTLTFRSVQPRYSYVKTDKNGYVIEAAQKKPISLFATVGVFWFSTSKNLVESIKNMIRKDANVDGNFYVAPAFNEIILDQGKIGTVEIDTKRYHPLKTERQVHQFDRTGAL